MKAQFLSTNFNATDCPDIAFRAYLHQIINSHTIECNGTQATATMLSHYSDTHCLDDETLLIQATITAIDRNNSLETDDYSPFEELTKIKEELTEQLSQEMNLAITEVSNNSVILHNESNTITLTQSDYHLFIHWTNQML